MKFKVTLDLDIWNQEFLDMINDNREWDDLAPYSSIEEIPEHEIQEFIENSDYIKEDIDNFGYDIAKIELVSKEEAE